MTALSPERPLVASVLAVTAILFGALTLLSGGATLFFDGAARSAAGDYVGFVLWFNFIAGFAYVVAGVGLFGLHRWGSRLSVLICVATLTVFVAFGIHILLGGAFEPRTVGAMILRSAVWLVIAVKAQTIELGDSEA